MAMADIRMATMDTVRSNVSEVVHPKSNAEAVLLLDSDDAIAVDVPAGADALDMAAADKISVIECGVAVPGAPVHSTIVPSW